LAISSLAARRRFVAARALAHHSTAAFDMEKTIEIGVPSKTFSGRTRT
jgi:hypothetical protein